MTLAPYFFAFDENDESLLGFSFPFFFRYGQVLDQL